MFRRILEDGTIEAGTTTSGGTGTGFKYVQATAPVTADLATGDLWLDTSTASSSVSPAIRLWDGVAWNPASGSPLGTLLLQESFTGTDGAAWNGSRWGLGRNNLGGPAAPGGATLLAGTGVLAASSSSISYDPNTTVSRKALIADTADVHVLLSFKWDSTNSFFWIHARHSTNTLDRADGYSLYLAKETNTWGLQKATSYTTTAIGSAQSLTWAANTWYNVRFKVQGTAIKGKVWLTSATEPGSWTVDTTDGTYTSAGKTGLSISGGAAATTQRRVFVDNLTIRAT